MKTLMKCACFFAAALALAALLTLPMLEREYAGVYDKTLRLHILANSDSAEDQALKLKVRDGVVSYLSPILSSCETREEAEKTVEALLPEIERVADGILDGEGADVNARAVLGREFYPTRVYEELSYPAGEYESLRIYLGAGEGQNWWCVVYPPLCLGAARADSPASDNYSEEEQAFLETKNDGYKVRFLLLDLAARLKKLFSR